MKIFDKWNKRIMALIMIVIAIDAMAYYISIEYFSNSQEISIVDYIFDFVVKATHNQSFVLLSLIFVVRIIINNIKTKKEVTA